MGTGSKAYSNNGAEVRTRFDCLAYRSEDSTDYDSFLKELPARINIHQRIIKPVSLPIIVLRIDRDLNKIVRHREPVQHGVPSAIAQDKLPSCRSLLRFTAAGGHVHQVYPEQVLVPGEAPVQYSAADHALGNRRAAAVGPILPMYRLAPVLNFSLR